MRNRVFVGYISLAQAIIDQAHNDVASVDRTSSNTNWKLVARDAEVFLKSDWCQYLQEVIQTWHQRNSSSIYNDVVIS